MWNKPWALAPIRWLVWETGGYSVALITWYRILEKNTGVGCHFLLQGIFPTQGSNPCLLHCRQTLSPLRHQGSPENEQPWLTAHTSRWKMLLYNKWRLICIKHWVHRIHHHHHLDDHFLSTYYVPSTRPSFWILVFTYIYSPFSIFSLFSLSCSSGTSTFNSFS